MARSQAPFCQRHQKLQTVVQSSIFVQIIQVPRHSTQSARILLIQLRRWVLDGYADQQSHNSKRKTVGNALMSAISISDETKLDFSCTPNEIFIKTSIFRAFNKISVLQKKRYCISPTCWFHSGLVIIFRRTVNAAEDACIPFPCPSTASFVHSCLRHVRTECPAIIAVLFYICNNRISGWSGDQIPYKVHRCGSDQRSRRTVRSYFRKV